jgi:hypothetical protein
MKCLTVKACFAKNEKNLIVDLTERLSDTKELSLVRYHDTHC